MMGCAVSAAESVIALVSGFPRGARERRLFMVIQVCIDDSSTAGENLVLAGYMARSEAWATFATEWAELLTIRPSWKRFKMSEIMSNWPGEETGERVVHHYRLIEKYVDSAICVVVPRRPITKAARDLGMPNFAQNPYYLAWRAIITLCLKWKNDAGVSEPIDFIFDQQQGEAAVVSAGWDNFTKGMPIEWSGLAKNRPIFRSDDDFLPLQAADLLAWWMRKRYEAYGTILRESFPFPWIQARQNGPEMYLSEYDERGIRKQMKLDRQALLRDFCVSMSATWRQSEQPEWTPLW